MTNRTDATGLHRPDFNFSPWHDEVNENFETIDAIFKNLLDIGDLKGRWVNSTAVVVGDRYFDDDNATFYEVAIAHTTAAEPTTFAEDRTANPTYWINISLEGTLDAASTATTKAAEAEASATAAATSETNAANSETAAAASAAAAAASATAADADATTATTKAAEASNSATIANNAAAEARDIVYPNGPPLNIAHAFFQGA